MELPKGSIMVWTRGYVGVDGKLYSEEDVVIDTWELLMNSLVPSEHNRAPLEASVERIKTSNRMYNGRLREYVIGDKRTWSTSWSLLPQPSDRTVDKRAGAGDIEAFYDSQYGSFVLSIVSGDAGKNKDISAVKHYEVVFSDFSSSIEKRGAYDMYSVSVSMEQV